MLLDAGARHFVGAMPPDTFLETFMKPAANQPAPVPRTDFSKVVSTNSVPDMSKALVRSHI